MGTQEHSISVQFQQGMEELKRKMWGWIERGLQCRDSHEDFKWELHLRGISQKEEEVQLGKQLHICFYRWARDDGLQTEQL